MTLQKFENEFIDFNNIARTASNRDFIQFYDDMNKFLKDINKEFFRRNSQRKLRYLPDLKNYVGKLVLHKNYSTRSYNPAILLNLEADHFPGEHPSIGICFADIIDLHFNISGNELIYDVPITNIKTTENNAPAFLYDCYHNINGNRNKINQSIFYFIHCSDMRF